MKKSFFLLTLIATLLALPPVAGAKDKDKDRDKAAEYEKKLWKEMRDDVRQLQKEHERLVTEVKVGGVSRRTQDDVYSLGLEVQRISVAFDRGTYDYRSLRDRISRAKYGIARTRDQVIYERSSRPRYYR